MSHDCKAWPGTCGTVGCDNACSVVASHPSHVVCPCNSGMPGPCPYITPFVPEVAPLPYEVPTWPEVVPSWPYAPPAEPSPWYVPTIAPTFGPLRVAWECPRCGTVNAPHADSCSCTRAASSTSATVTVRRGDVKITITEHDYSAWPHAPSHVECAACPADDSNP